jgi:hypothetical protein
MFPVQGEWLHQERWEAVTGLLHLQEAQVLCSSAITGFLGKFKMLFKQAYVHVSSPEYSTKL